MAKQISLNHTDTAIDGVTVLPLNRGLVNFGADFRAISDEPNEFVLTNMTSPLDAAEKFRFCTSDVTNVYKNAGVDPSLYAPSKRGKSILVQLTQNVTVTDDTDPTYRVVLPFECHLVVRIPTNENVTASMVEGTVARMLSGLYDTGSTTSDRYASLIKGALSPTDI